MVPLIVFTDNRTHFEVTVNTDTRQYDDMNCGLLQLISSNALQNTDPNASSAMIIYVSQKSVMMMMMLLLVVVVVMM